MRKLVRTQTNNTRTIKLPVFLVNNPKNSNARASVCLINYYWAVTDNNEILIHKWYDSYLKPRYMPQANQTEEAMANICKANGLAHDSYVRLPLVYLDIEYFGIDI